MRHEEYEGKLRFDFEGIIIGLLEMVVARQLFYRSGILIGFTEYYKKKIRSSD